MTSSIVLRYCLMFVISIRYFLIRFPAKICPPTRRNKLVIVIRTTKEKDVKFVSNAGLFLNLILLLPHGGANIYHIQSFFSFHYLLQKGEVGIPSSLLIPVRASGTLVTLKETGATGSIDPEKSGNPLKVYCDMTTDGGEI